MKDYNVMIDEKNFFDQPVKHMITFEKFTQLIFYQIIPISKSIIKVDKGSEFQK